MDEVARDRNILRARIAELDAERERLADSIRKLLTNINESMTCCSRCHAEIAFVRHRNGKFTPYEMDGRNHFIACPAANEFRKKQS